MSRSVPRLLLSAWLACAVASPAYAQGVATVRPLFEQEVARLAAEHNPQLRAALLQADSARWNALGLESQYAAVIAGDMSATQTRAPVLSRSLSGPPGSNPLEALFTGAPLIAIAGVRRADAGLELRKHTLWGTDIALRVAPNILQTYADPRALTFNVPGWSPPQYGGLVKLSLKQPLLKGRGAAVNEAELRAARVRRDIATHARDRVASEVLRDALTAYWELWHAESALAIELQGRAVASRQRDDAAFRVANGALAPVELLVFDAQVATRDEAISHARHAQRERQIELLQQLGAIGTDMVNLHAESEPVAALPPLDVAEQRALAESAELKELFSSLELARVQATTASNPFRAKLDFDAWIQGQGLATVPKGEQAWVSQFNALSGFIGLSFEAPINRNRQEAEETKARLAIEVAEENLQRGRQRIVAQLGVMREKGSAAEEASALAERTLEIALQQLAAEQDRYAMGSSTSLQVLEAEDKVRNAQLRVVRLRADFVESVLAVAHYSGALIEHYVGVLGG